VSKDSIDASLGLGFSVELFLRYKKSGTLQAEIRRFPGVKGRGIAYLLLVEGVVTSCFVDDRNGQRMPVSKDVLIRFDKDKGPFEWRFYPSDSPKATQTPAASMQTPPEIQAVYPRSSQGPAPRTDPLLSPLLSDVAVPRIVAPLDWKLFRSWTARQQQMLAMVWQLIDGQRSVREIKAATASSLPAPIVEEALVVFLKLRAISITA
jgi:hypothetical protein